MQPANSISDNTHSQKSRSEGRGAALLALLLPLLWFSVSCGADEDPLVVVDRIHDLVVSLPSGQFSKPSPYAKRPVTSVEQNDHRDGMAYLVGTPGAPLVFHGLFTEGPAVFQFGVGVGHLGGGQHPPGPPVWFQIEQGGDDSWEVIFREKVSLYDLSPPNHFLPRSVSLPGFEPVLRSLRLSVWTDTEGAPPSWPGWISPHLLSDGRKIPLSENTIAMAMVSQDLIETLPSAKILEESSEWPVTGTLFATTDEAIHAGGKRALIRAAAPSRLAWNLTPPPGAVLDFAVGVDQEKGWSIPGDGMTFAVEVEGKRIWELFLHASRRPRDRGWKSASIDLSPWAGKNIALELVTEPGENSDGDVGGWSNIAVRHHRAIPRLAAGGSPHVIVIMVDTLRQDALDRGSEATPHFERSATAGVRFTQARSASSWTWPSTASLFTGLYPNSHGVHDNARCYLVEGLDTMGEIFSLNGYTTAAFLANVLISTENNFHQGFETFANLANLSARALNERVAHWLDNTDGTTRFLYLHYFDPHTPYRAPDDHNADAEMVIEQEIVERLASQREADMVDPALIEEWMDLLRRRYDREVAYLDKAFGELMTLLEDHGILENALLVVTSDHGEEFYEHGKLSHGPHLYDETVRVPLWITGYGKAALPPKTIHIPAENKNVLPTLLQILDMTHPPHPSWGFSLLNPRQEPTFLQTWHGTEPGSAGWIERLALVGAEHKFIYTPSLDRQELFDLSEDPFEQVNRASHDSEITDKMAKALAAWNQQTLSEAPGVTLGENAEVQAWMAELGYVGGEGGN